LFFLSDNPTKLNNQNNTNSTLYLDARFNKGLIENCETDIHKHCRNEIIDDDDNGDESDDDKDDSTNQGKIFLYYFLYLNFIFF